MFIQTLGKSELERKKGRIEWRGFRHLEGKGGGKFVKQKKPVGGE